MIRRGYVCKSRLCKSRLCRLIAGQAPLQADLYSAEGDHQPIQEDQRSSPRDLNERLLTTGAHLIRKGSFGAGPGNLRSWFRGCVIGANEPSVCPTPNGPI